VKRTCAEAKRSQRRRVGSSIDWMIDCVIPSSMLTVGRGRAGYDRTAIMATARSARSAGEEDEADAKRASSDPSTCPLCGGPNGCVVGDDSLRDATCWCVGLRFSDRLFSRIPPLDLGRRCVCARCANGEAETSR
jgi:hypothetical protein